MLYPLNVYGGEDQISYQFLNHNLRVATPIALPPPIQNGGDVAEAEPVRSNSHYHGARYKVTCPVAYVLIWDYVKFTSFAYIMRCRLVLCLHVPSLTGVLRALRKRILVWPTCLPPAVGGLIVY